MHRRIFCSPGCRARRSSSCFHRRRTFGREAQFARGRILGINCCLDSRLSELLEKGNGNRYRKEDVNRLRLGGTICASSVEKSVRSSGVNTGPNTLPLNVRCAPASFCRPAGLSTAIMYVLFTPFSVMYLPSAVSHSSLANAAKNALG